jgi:hypothetical protein
LFVKVLLSIRQNVEPNVQQQVQLRHKWKVMLFGRVLIWGGELRSHFGVESWSRKAIQSRHTVVGVILGLVAAFGFPYVADWSLSIEYRAVLSATLLAVAGLAGSRKYGAITGSSTSSI